MSKSIEITTEMRKEAALKYLLSLPKMGFTPGIAKAAARMERERR